MPGADKKIIYDLGQLDQSPRSGSPLSHENPYQKTENSAKNR